MEKNKAANPLNVGPFRADAVVLESNALPDLVQELRRLIHGVYAPCGYRRVNPKEATCDAVRRQGTERYTPEAACFNTPLLVSTFS